MSSDSISNGMFQLFLIVVSFYGLLLLGQLCKWVVIRIILIWKRWRKRNEKNRDASKTSSFIENQTKGGY